MSKMPPGASHDTDEQPGLPAPSQQPPVPSNRPPEQPNVPPPRFPKSRLWNAGLPDSILRPGLQGTAGLDSPMSQSSDSPYDQLSPSATDRVFPIRSVVSVDPTPTPQIRSEGSKGDGFPGMGSPSNSTSAERQHELHQHPMSSSPSVEESSDCDESSSRPRHDLEKSAPAAHGSGSRNSVVGDFKSSPPSRLEGRDRLGGSPQMQSITDNVSRSSRDSAIGSVRNNAEDKGAIFTPRFKHVITEEGHAVITGRDGETLRRCEDEPIRIPGAVQSFGLLIALQEEDDCKFRVRVVSENSKQIIGYTPKQLFELDSFCDILSEEQTDNLLDHVDFIREEDSDPAIHGPEVFTMTIRSSTRKSQKLWCAMHNAGNIRGLIICEFELEDDIVNPLVPTGERTTESPEDTLQSNPTAEDFAESTINMSKPLRVLRSARKRKGEAAAMEVFNIMSQVQEQLASAPSIDTFLKVLVGVVKELTGFHRVMIYQFDQSWNGKVVTELVDTHATKDLYRGLNFPASDIPSQARELYKINKVRLLYDREQETARLVCRTIEDLENPLDLTFAYLRAMSPIHIKYLRNMAVRASMSISINAFNELWGLIACHAYGSKGMRVSFPIRKMCRLVGDSASRNIERLHYASQLQARKLINTVPTESNPSGYIIASSDDLLKLFDADYGLLSIRGEAKILGKLEQTQEALAMLEYLRIRKITSVTNSIDIKSDFPDIRYTPGFNVIAGLLLVPLSIAGSDFIVFFRKSQARDVKWAGNPYQKVVKEGTDEHLEPRQSFKIWSERVVGKCRDWTEQQTETAAVLCLVYGKFIEVWRQKEAAIQTSELTKLLLANSAHEFRTPLNAIINYLEIALEGAIDPETRENLSKSHSASKSLIYVINDLLDLTKMEQGNNLIKDEVFDLPATVREAANMFAGDAKRKQIEYEVTENPGVPQHVIGDQRRVRQAISNLIANAIEHTSSGGIQIATWLVEHVENHVEIDIAIEDTGIGMSTEKLDSLFRELEQVQSSEDIGALQEKLLSESDQASVKQRGKTLGLGLALVARIIRNMNGQLRLKSEEGKGSRFVIQLGFGLPGNDRSHLLLGSGIAASVDQPSQPSTPPVEKGEILLVNNSAQKGSPAPTKDISRRRSTNSIRGLSSSLKSFKSSSSGRSDVDRLIDAIREPHMVPNSQSSVVDNQRLGSPSRPGRRQGSYEGSSKLSRSHSLGTVSAAYQEQQTPGESAATDPGTPTRPIRMLSGSLPVSSGSEVSQTPARVLFDAPDKRPDPPTAHELHVLVAEDDPINSKIVMKRLEKLGHSVHLTINGEECFRTYGERAGFFDVVLMDMQMPIVDGMTSTKMIRSYDNNNPEKALSTRAAFNGRIPIFAVSASLVEKDRHLYIEAGFDGWILKPIDFKRLSILLTGIVDEDTRDCCLYRSGEWEQGGWFARQQSDIFYASSVRSSRALGLKAPPKLNHPQPVDDPISAEQDRLDRLETDASHARSSPQDPGTSGDLDRSVLEGAATLPRGPAL